jgi:hypothetical protein
VLQRSLNLWREVADGGGAAGQPVEGGDQIGGNPRRVQAKMLDDAQRVGVRLLLQLIKPVNGFHVGVAAHLAKDGGGLDGFVAQRIEFSEESCAFNFSHK